MRRILDVGAQRLDSAARRLLTPGERLARNRERLAQLARRLRRALPEVPAQRLALGRSARRFAVALTRGLRERSQRLAGARSALAHLDPTQVLGRGYSIVRDADGKVRTTSAGLAAGEPLDITFSEGGAEVTVRTPRPPRGKGNMR
jgi:exodeoxyribonuclease VII large subunit